MHQEACLQNSYHQREDTGIFPEFQDLLAAVATSIMKPTLEIAAVTIFLYTSRSLWHATDK